MFNIQPANKQIVLIIFHTGRSKTDCKKQLCIYGPRQANLVLIAYASSEGSGEPAHPRSLARTSAARSNKQGVKRNRQKARSLAPLNGWACAVKICNDGMLEDTNSLDGALMSFNCVFLIEWDGGSREGLTSYNQDLHASKDCIRNTLNGMVVTEKV